MLGEAAQGSACEARGQAAEGHTRRGFFDEWEHHKSPTAKQALERIAAIYAIEARAAFAPVAGRIELPRQIAPPVDEFFYSSKAMVEKLSAKSSLTGAFRSAIDRQEALSRFLSNGRLEIDNNIAENAMRGLLLAARITSSPFQMPAVTPPAPSTPSSRRQN